MRRVVVTEYISLDGVVEHPAWTAPYWGDDIAQFKGEEMSSAEALLLGRVTYEGFAQAWPAMEGQPGADIMNSIPKHVATRTLDTLTWNATRLSEPIVETVQQLKQQDGGNLLVYGSANFVQTLTQHDLVDEYRFLIYPVVLGTGAKMFADGIAKNLKLVSSQTFASGVVALIYHPANT